MVCALPHWIGIVVLGLMPVLAADKDQSKTNLEQVLARARTAVGYQTLTKLPNGMRLEGAYEGRGLTGRYSLQFAPGGKFLRRVESRMKDMVAFDGATCWGADDTGMPRVLELDDLEKAETTIWVQTGHWLAENGPFRIKVVEEETNDDQVSLDLELPSRAKTGRLILDQATGLPKLLRRRWAVGDETWEFQDYRKTAGVMLAHKVVQTTGPQTATVVIETVHEVPADKADIYKPVLTRPNDTRFDPSVPAAVPVKRNATGHLFVHPKVNGKDVGWFCLDTGTGSGMVITKAAADELNLPSFGQVVSVGAGKPEASVFRHGTTFELGPITISETNYTEMPPRLTQVLSRNDGFKLAGTCGYGIFSRAVIALDWKEEKLEIHDPEHYELPKGSWQPLSLNQRIPCVICEFEEKQKGLFRLDTGCPLVLFHSPAVEKLNLLEGRVTHPTSLGGVGGAAAGRAGGLNSFVVAGHQFDKPAAVFVTTKEGALAEPYTLGTFGGRFLAPFQIVFDYAHRRIAFLER